MYFQQKNSNCGDFRSTRGAGQQRSVTSWKCCAIVFAPGVGSMDRCEYPEISEISKARFIKTKLCDPFTPKQNFYGLPVLLSAQLFSIGVLNKAPCFSYEPSCLDTRILEHKYKLSTWLTRLERSNRDAASSFERFPFISYMMVQSLTETRVLPG